MDLLTLFGALFGVTAIVAGFSLEGGHFTSLFQLEAFVIVVGGTFGAVMIQNTWARFYDGLKQLRLYMPTPPRDRNFRFSVRRLA